MKPSDTVRQRIHVVRISRGWTLDELAGRLLDLQRGEGGRSLANQRSTVQKLESGTKKTVDIDEVFQYAAALGVSPRTLLQPWEGDTVDITERMQLPASLFAAWVDGNGPLREADLPVYFDNEPEHPVYWDDDHAISEHVEEFVAAAEGRKVSPDEKEALLAFVAVYERKHARMIQAARVMATSPDPDAAEAGRKWLASLEDDRSAHDLRTRVEGLKPRKRT